MTPKKPAASADSEAPRPPIPVPEFSHKAGIYQFRWPALDLPEWSGATGVKIRVDRLYQDSHFNVTAEITIKLECGETDGHVNQGRLTLTGPTSRATLARQLEKRVPVGDWEAMLEQVCVRTLVAYREGEPVIGVGHKPLHQNREYRLDPILIEGAPTGIYAPGGSGKGQAVTLAACLIHYGHEWGAWTPRKGNVLYLDWETSNEEINRRVYCMKQGLGIDDPREVFYRRCWNPLADDIEEIQRECLDKDIKAVIVDSFGMACQGDNNKEEAVLRFYSGFRSLGLTGLIVDHSNKEGGLYGNSYKWNSARAVFELKKVAEDREAGTLDINLIHQKVNEGVLLAPFGIRFTFLDNDLMTIPEPFDLTVATLQAKVAQKDAIIAALKRGTLTSKEIAATTGISVASVRSAMNRYKDSLWVKVGNEWGLRSNVPELL